MQFWASPARKQGKYMQSYGIDATGHVTHAGVTNHRRMTARVARKIQAKWLVWRKRYLREHPGEYPLRHCDPTVAVQMHPIGKPELCRVFAIADARESAGVS